MQGQIFKKDASNEDFEALKKQFNDLKSSEVEKAGSVVNLRMYTGCGCGGHRTDIHALVPDGVDFNFYEREDFDKDDIERWEEKGVVFKKGYVTDTDNYNPDSWRNIDD